METRSNRLLVALVCGLLLVGLAAFAWYIGAGTTAYDARYRIAFNQSVSGLSAGAPVTLSGVQVGRVTRIFLSPGGKGRPMVEVALDSDLPVRAGFRADISRSLLDGSAVLVLLPSTEGPLVNPPDEESVGTIAAVEGAAASDPAGQAVQVSTTLDGAVRALDPEGQAEAARTLEETRRSTAQWQRSVERLLGSVDREQVRGVGEGIEDFTRSTDRLNTDVQGSREDVENVRRSIRDAGNQAERVGESIERQRGSVRQLDRQAQGVTQDLRSLGRTVQDLNEKAN